MALQHHLLLTPLSLFFLFLFLFLLFLFLKKSKPKSNLPPSPPRLPIIGNLLQLGTLPHRSLHAMSQKYGSLMLLYMGTTPTIVVSTAEMAREIMKTHDVVFSDRPVTTASKIFLFGSRDVAFARYGEYWRQVRKITVIDLLSVKRVRSYRFVREEEIAGMLKKLREACTALIPVNLSGLVVTLTNNIISRIALGRRLEREVGDTSELAELTKEVMDLFGVFSVEDMLPSLGWIDVLTGLKRRMKGTSKRFHEFLGEVIEDHLVRKQEDDRKDFVHILLDCQKDVSLGIPISTNDIKAIILDMFVAGTDTTYTTIEWAMAELIKHPQVMKRVQEEVRRVVGDKAIVNENDINQMHYLNCVIKETLRLRPPVVLSLPRVSTASTKIGSYSVPANIRLIINVWAIARDPKIWDRPDEFIPERFVNSPLDFKGFDYEFIPFGAGRRGCPGIAFGITSVESILANLLCWFDWEFPASANKKDLETEAFGLSVHLKHPLRLVPMLHAS